MSSTTSTASTSTSAVIVNPDRTRRHGRLRTIAAVMRALPARGSAPATPFPSNRWVAPMARDHALDPAYHLRMVR